MCSAGRVARMFVDLDGRSSVTCVPELPQVDLAFGGLALPSACVGVSCGLGACIDVGGFPACQCDEGAAAARNGAAAAVPVCSPIVELTGDPGGKNYTGALESVEVCAPPPPDCGKFGWLSPAVSANDGVRCPSSEPASPSALEVPAAPTCEDFGLITPDAGGGGSADDGSGCEAKGGASAPGAGVLLAWLALVAMRRRRAGRP